MPFNMSTVNPGFGFDNITNNSINVLVHVTSTIGGDPPGFTKIKVRWRRKGTNAWHTNSTDSVVPPSTGKSYTITGLTTATDYEFKVRYKLEGMSLFHNMASKFKKTT